MGENILITGANRGLGFALCEQLLEKGHQVYALNRHDSPCVSDLRDKYSQALHCYPCDVTEEGSIRKALGKLADEAGHLDILLNNAAVHLDPARLPLEQLDFSVYLPAFQANCVGPLMVVRYALPLLRQGTGRLVVNFSSEAGSISACWRKSEYSYCMTKAALNMASRILQNALMEEKIKVLALHPGWFSSDMGGSNAPITPIQAATEIIKVILHPPALVGPIFVDSSGAPLEW